MLNRRKKKGFEYINKNFVDFYVPWGAIVAAVAAIAGGVTKIAGKRNVEYQQQESGKMLQKMMAKAQEREHQKDIATKLGEKREAKEYNNEIRANDEREMKEKTRFKSFNLGRNQISNIFGDINQRPQVRDRFIEILKRGR